MRIQQQVADSGKCQGLIRVYRSNGQIEFGAETTTVQRVIPVASG